MRRVMGLAAVMGAAAALSGCANTKASGFGNRGAPNEFVVTRSPPLVIPPDFALRPPKPGAPRPQEASAATQAIAAMFGGTARVSPGQQTLIDSAGPVPEAGVRSEASDPDTDVVDKGATATREILAAPTGGSGSATATTPQ